MTQTCFSTRGQSEMHLPDSDDPPSPYRLYEIPGASHDTMQLVDANGNIVLDQSGNAIGGVPSPYLVPIAIYHMGVGPSFTHPPASSSATRRHDRSIFGEISH
jgi:hypothetical protein